MSTLIVLIPQRQRLRARGPASSDGAAARGTEYLYVTTNDGAGIVAQGYAAPKLLPKATSVIAVVHASDVSWHRITVPKAPAGRLRAALGGMIEENLLDDAESVHLAIAPGPVVGQPSWIAAVDRDWFGAELAELEGADIFVDRVVPMAWPEDPPGGHFEVGADAVAGPVLTWAHPDGVATFRMQGGFARALIPQAPAETRWSASPGAAGAAEQLLGAPVAVVPIEQRLLRAARSNWNLLQFDLVRRAKGTRAVREAWRRFLGPQWRPVRIGAAALVVIHLIGLNGWAWQQRRTIEDRRAAVQALVRSTFPRVSPQDIERDPVAVFEREAQAVRAQAGKPGDTDLETMLQVAAAAWPGGAPPVASVRFEPGALTLSTEGWSPDQVEQFRDALRGSGWEIAATGQQVTLTRSRTGVPA